MEEKINIAAILKDKPNGLRLYSPIFGDCTFCCVREDTNDICVKKHNGMKCFFDSKGLYYNTGEVMLFPSKEMRDWRKFTLKKGDVLVSNDGKIEVIFEKFNGDTYQSFTGKHQLDSLDENLYYQDGGVYPTAIFNIETEDAAQTYIKTIEEKLDGKLNLESLEIEKPQPEFKDGDIVIYGKSVAICRKFYKHTLCFYVSLNDMFGLLFNDEVESSEEYRFATEEEKQQLFSALEKEGKAWDSDKKAIVDLKPKWTPKTFDKVITRVHNKAIWTANIFSHIDQHGKYVTIGCISGYTYCLPYNDETAHLIGTTDDWEGGEQ